MTIPKGRTDVLTGREIREACELLRWTRYDMQRRTALPLVEVDLIMASAGATSISLADEVIVKEAFRRAGIEFGSEGFLLRTEGRD